VACWFNHCVSFPPFGNFEIKKADNPVKDVGSLKALMSIYVIAKELFGCVALVHLSTPAFNLVLADDPP
jgi:hypothetical protein